LHIYIEQEYRHYDAFPKRLSTTTTFGVTPQVFSTQRDHRNLLMTVIVGLCLYYRTDNGRTTDGPTSASNAYLEIKTSQQ